jgi:hypothetical protein
VNEFTAVVEKMNLHLDDGDGDDDDQERDDDDDDGQTDQAVEIARLIKQYITIDQRTRGMTLEKEPASGPASRVASRQANFSD